MISIDTETTGVDFRHGAKPYFVTTCIPGEDPRYWEWDVDPLTRQPIIPEGDVQGIGDYLFADGEKGPGPYVLQNAKFDMTALGTIGLWGRACGYDPYEVWKDVEDTLIAGHVLASNRPKDLTSMAYQYLGVPIEKYEKALEVVVQECRRKVQQARLREKRKGEGEGGDFAAWAIAEAGRPDMPSAKEKTWKFDGWLPRAMVKYLWEASEAGKAWTEGRGIEDGLEEMDGWDLRPPNLWEGKDTRWTALREYANADSWVTANLFPKMEATLKARGYWAHYREQMRVAPVLCRMEGNGITLSRSREGELRDEYEEKAETSGNRCVNVAENYQDKCEACGGLGREPEDDRTPLFTGETCGQCDGSGSVPYKLVLPKGGNNKSLTRFMLEVLNLPVVGWTEKGNPSLDKEAFDTYLETLPPRGLPMYFIRNLAMRRKRMTYCTYMDGYRRFWLPYLHDEDRKLDVCFKAHGLTFDDFDDTMVMYSSINQTGTDTLRMSSSNPNQQNVGKQGMVCFSCYGIGCEDCNDTGEDPRSLRYLFGPAPGREWYSCDAQNIELRLPAYESGEEELIALFENPGPPYYGSEHLLNFSTVYPDIWEMELEKVGLEKVGPHCKKKYKATNYQWCKNGDFAVGYGAIDRPGGTADRAFHKVGAHSLLKKRFSKKERLNQYWIKYAERYGYVETMPDRTVDPSHGYPLLCTRTDEGRILPTVPLNYHVQGTAMWWMRKAMVRCQEQLDAWREESGFDARIVMQVHDELVFDFPKSRLHPREDLDPSRPSGMKLLRKSNLWRVRKLQSLMEQGGDDLGVPTPTSCEYHEHNWSEGVSL